MLQQTRSSCFCLSGPSAQARGIHIRISHRNRNQLRGDIPAFFLHIGSYWHSLAPPECVHRALYTTMLLRGTVQGFCFLFPGDFMWSRASYANLPKTLFPRHSRLIFRYMDVSSFGLAVVKWKEHISRRYFAAQLFVIANDKDMSLVAFTVLCRQLFGQVNHVLKLPSTRFRTTSMLSLHGRKWFQPPPKSKENHWPSPPKVPIIHAFFAPKGFGVHEM